jgi:RHS repeat-associated protein
LSGEGRVQVTIQPGSGTLRSVSIGPANNAVLDFPGGPSGSHGNLAAPIPSGGTILQFVVQREAAGTSVTVPLAVEDGCGTWQSMVGAGPQTWRAVLSGEVRNGQSPLSGAKVHVLGPGLETTTDFQGRFAFGDLPVGSYTLVTELAGYVSDRRDVTVASGAGAAVQITLTSLTPSNATPTPTLTGAPGTVPVPPASTTTATVTPNATISAPTPTLPPPPSGLPPDPRTVAPPLPAGSVASLADATSFLYTGSNPIQTGVAPNTIQPQRAAVLRGKVLDRVGQPLPGVTIAVLGHPEFGQTQSRADGLFDLAVNGGGVLTVTYSRDGFLSAQRQVTTPWQEYIWLPDVILIQLDAQVTRVDLGSSSPVQVARGSQVTDADGARQATLLFPQGIHATMKLPNGSEQPLTSLSVRATEYTVGPNGQKAMPGGLPPTSGYTYAVELSVDEAQAAGATDVRFDRPVPAYLENFLHFPVGAVVPSGSYDRTSGQWVASDNGRVVKILSAPATGPAVLDVKGSGTPASPSDLNGLGITDAELQRLATLYTVGQTLWRVPLTHFTPWDWNWAYGPPGDAVPPNLPPRSLDNNAPAWPEGPGSRPSADHPCGQNGSIIACESQSLGEAVDLAGTSLRLHYQSDRVPGSKGPNRVEIPITGGSVAQSLEGANVSIVTQGQSAFQSFSNAPNQSYTFEWDGTDGYGRALSGGTYAMITVQYLYPAIYGNAAEAMRAFMEWPDAGIGGLGDTRDTFQVAMTRTWKLPLGGIFAGAVGGWTLSEHHTYDPRERVVYLGDGQKRSLGSPGPVVTAAAGAGGSCEDNRCGDGGPAVLGYLWHPQGVAVGPDGSLYIADSRLNRVRRVGPDGIIRTFAGTGAAGSSGDGGPATQAELNGPQALAIGPDGSLFVSDSVSLRRVGPDGIIRAYPSPGAVNGPLVDITAGPDGSVYFTDDARVRKIGTDGQITTVAGTGTSGFSGDGGPARQAQLRVPSGLAVGPDGSLYISDGGDQRIRRVGPDGIIRTVAGTGTPGSTGDGGPATLARLDGPGALSVSRDGNLYIVEGVSLTGSQEETGFYGRVRRVSSTGLISTVVAAANTPPVDMGSPASQLRMHAPTGIALAPDGSLYVADASRSRVYNISVPTPVLSGAETTIPSEDGDELWVFNPGGRHLRTLDALTRSVLYEFGYDAAGRLISVRDVDGNMTTIERDGTGAPTAIVSPFGQRTAVSVDGHGFLNRITNPNGDAVQLTYTNDGLLTELADPRSGRHRFAYDSLGRLTRDEDPAGGVKTLTRTTILQTPAQQTYKVGVTTAEGRTTTYEVTNWESGATTRIITDPSGLHTLVDVGVDGGQHVVTPDGTEEITIVGPDPRWGMLVPVPQVVIRTLPGGLRQTIQTQRAVTLADPNQPLSLQTWTQTAESDDGRTSSVEYVHGAAPTLTATSAAGRLTVLTLNDRGRPVRLQPDGLAPTSYSYDQRGQLTTVTVGTGTDARQTTYAYNAAGLATSATDHLGRTLAFTYDPAGRMLSQTNFDTGVVGMSYDPDGNPTALTPPGRTAHSFTFTPADLLASYTPPDVGAPTGPTTFSYNRDHQLTRVAQPGGQTADLAYDAGKGRVASLTTPGGSISYTYDPTGGQTTGIAGPGGTSLSLAHLGAFLTDESWSGPVTGTVSRRYDARLRITSRGVNGTDQDLAYDADDLLVRTGALTLTRDAHTGLVTRQTVGNTVEALTYNGFGEPATSQVTLGPITALFAVQYTRDGLGRITEKRETLGGTTDTYAYSYDVIGHLTEVRRNGALIASYTYDRNNNRLSATDATGNVNATYDAQDRLTQYGSATYTYAANGDLAQRSAAGLVTAYQYDALGNLLGVNRSDGTQIEYVVDGRNRRVGRKVNGTLVQGFLYQDDLRPAAELDGSNNVVSRFFYADDSPVPAYMVRGGSTYRVIADQVGSPRLIVEITTGVVAQRLAYDAFGNVLEDTSPGFQPFGFAGGLYDPSTGLVRFGARDYDASVGRWTSKDPVLFQGGQSNLYAYVGNDPINFRDSTGLEEEQACKPGLWKKILDEDASLGKKQIKEELPKPAKDTWNRFDKIKGWFDKAEKAMEDYLTLKDAHNEPTDPEQAAGYLKWGLDKLKSAQPVELMPIDAAKETLDRGMVHAKDQRYNGTVNTAEARQLMELEK